jgi:hypothetical protein
MNPHGTQLQWRNRNTKIGRLPKQRGGGWVPAAVALAVAVAA